MGTIAPELISFKTSVEPSLSSMNTMCQTIQNKMSDVGNAASYARSTIESNYSSSNSSIVISKLDKLNTIYSKVNSSVGGDMKNIISQAETLISLVKELENINNQIETKNEIINSKAGNTDPASINEVNNANYDLTRLNKTFAERHDVAVKKLASLKTLDASFNFTGEFSPSNTNYDLSDLQYGTFETRKFVSSTGEEIDYCVYVPDYGKDVKNLPAMLYMHGSVSSYNDPNWNTTGLTGLIKNQSITPSGIVVMPHIKNHKDYQTLKELMDYIVEEYECDKERLSVSGHSSGAVATYGMLNAYPGYFAAAIPISGCDYTKITEKAVEGTQIWAFGGSAEYDESYSTATRTDVGQGAIRKVNNLGGEGFFTILKGNFGYHCNTNKGAFTGNYTSPDGEEVNVLEWAFSQRKA